MSSYNKSGETLAELQKLQEPSCNRGMIDEYTIDLFVNTADNTLFVLTFMSAALQIYIIRKALKEIRRSSIDQCLHTFILSMTFGNFLLTGFCYPLEFISRMELVAVSKIIHQAVHFSTWVALLGSSLSLVLLNIEKLLYFKYPLRYLLFVNCKRGVACVIVVSCFSLLFVSVSWYLKYFNPLKGKYFRPSTVTSFAVACYTLNEIFKQRKSLEEEKVLSSSGKSTVTSAHSTGVRTFYFAFITTVFTVVTLLPFRIYQLQSKFFDDSYNTDFTEKKNCSQLFMECVMSYLLILNALLYPLITVTILPQYQLRLAKKFTSASTDFQTTLTEL